MEILNITAEIRNSEEIARNIRANKKLPCVVYGKNQEPISITLDASEFLKLYRKSWESNIINLNIGKKSIEVLVHQFQKEPVSGEFIHVDFYALTRGEALTTKVHLNFIGNSEAVKEGGILEELNKEIEIKCLPKNLVDHFDVDLSVLKEFGDNIKVSDLTIDSEKYEILTPNTEVLVLIGKPKVAEVISDEAPVSDLPVDPKEEETKWE